MSPLAIAADALAFAVGGLTTYFDYYDKFTQAVGRLPIAFRANPIVLAVSVGCGAIAAALCAITANPENVFSTVLTLKAPDPWRGAVVGASVLILLRSKFLNIQDSPFGGDRLYRFFQENAVQDVADRWSQTKKAFKSKNTAGALADPTFEQDVSGDLSRWIQNRPPALQAYVNNGRQTLSGNRPAGAFNAADPVWQTYYRALLDLAFDAAGPAQLVREFSYMKR